MSKIKLREINQSQLDNTPIIDGQLIVCLDTGNTYRDNQYSHIKIGSDLETVSELPLAPIDGKLYFLRPNDLYISSGGELVLLNDTNFTLEATIGSTGEDVRIFLNGTNESSICVKGSGATTVTSNKNGEVVISSPDPNDSLIAMTNTEIDQILST